MLKPISDAYVADSVAYGAPVAICEEDGKLWFCVNYSGDQWTKEEETSRDSDIMRAFECCVYLRGGKTYNGRKENT